MRTIATILAGPGAEAVIGDALRSVRHHVDAALILLSGCDPDATRAVVGDSGVFPYVEDYEWPGDYGQARNHALARANALGFDWALTLDIDERLELRGEIPLSNACNAFGIMANPPTYSKPRFIRLGVGAKWVGKYCEQLEVEGGIALLPDAGSFSELPKTPEQERARIDRGIAWCESMEADGTITPHWQNHLGECLAALGRWEPARDRWRQVLANAASPLHERTWASLRLAEQELVRGELAAARNRAAAALGEDPGLIQELGTVMAVASSQLGDNQSALLWAEIVRVSPLDESRGGHRMLHSSVPSCERIVEELAVKGSNYGVKGFRRPACVKPHGKAESFSAEAFMARRKFLPDYERIARAIKATLGYVTTHLDLGAGNGLLVEAMFKSGATISLGIELETSAREATTEWVRDLIQYGNGADKWTTETPCKLVSCLEVLEHLPEAEAESAVNRICACSDEWILFSAAPPGQGGNGHINCQPKAYWMGLFESAGFAYSAGKTSEFIEQLGQPEHCWWIRQNAMIFRRVAA
jgi:hypothetical protein